VPFLAYRCVMGCNIIRQDLLDDTIVLKITALGVAREADLR
jgi:hypothetical protein